MRLNFRQGLLTYQTDVSGNPQFLQASSTKDGFISLIVSPKPTTIAFAHGKSDYLVTFDSTQENAWGPLVKNETNYLYWEIDLFSAKVSTGITTIKPVVSKTEPDARIEGAMWFDLNTNQMKIWSQRACKWSVRVRVLAGTVSGTRIIQEMIGTQVGINTESNPGYIMLDSALNPLRTSTGEFLTTDTPIRIKTTGGTSGVLAMPTNAFLPVRAGENLPAMSLVYFSAADTVSLASSEPAHSTKRIPVGIVRSELAINEVGILTQYGDITYDQWDWSQYIGRALYCDHNGKITPHRPSGQLVYRVGFVKNARTIVFGVDAETAPVPSGSGGATVAIESTAPITVDTDISPTGETTVTIGMPAATDAQDGYMTSEQARQVDLVKGIGVQVESLEENKLNKTGSIEISQVNNLSETLDDIRQNAGAKKLNDLQDVDKPTITDGVMLIWDAAGERWHGVIPPAGAKGDKGDKGDRGPSEYEVAKEQGYPGTETEWFRDKLTDWMANASVVIDAGDQY